MNRIEWPSLARGLAWLLAAAFVLGAIASVVANFVPLGTPPEPQEDFLESIVADFEHHQAYLPFEIAGSALFALGFAALGALGVAIARLADPDDGRRGIVSAAFLLGGGLGVASQLLWIGVRPVATSPHYCECGLLAEEIMARLMIMNVSFGIQMWLVNAAILAVAVGLVVGGALGREAGMPDGWWWLSLGSAALAILSSVLAFFALYPFDVLVVVLVAGILAPIWALWLGARARAIWPTDYLEAAEVVVET